MALVTFGYPSVLIVLKVHDFPRSRPLQGYDNKLIYRFTKVLRDANRHLKGSAEGPYGIRLLTPIEVSGIDTQSSVLFINSARPLAASLETQLPLHTLPLILELARMYLASSAENAS